MYRYWLVVWVAYLIFFLGCGVEGVFNNSYDVTSARCLHPPHRYSGLGFTESGSRFWSISNAVGKQSEMPFYSVWAGTILHFRKLFFSVPSSWMITLNTLWVQRPGSTLNMGPWLHVTLFRPVSSLLVLISLSVQWRQNNTLIARGFCTSVCESCL